MFEISDIWIENKSVTQGTEILVTDAEKPVISFQLQSGRRGTSLRSACIRLNGWEKTVTEQKGIRYEGKPLNPFTEYDVEIMAIDDAGNHCIRKAEFTTGRKTLPWKAKWITDETQVTEKPKSPRPLYFRRKIHLEKKVQKSWITVTAIGIFDLLLDGKRISEEYFAPGFTDYEYNLQYNCYRLDEVQAGEHELSVTVAAGWAVGRTTHISDTNKSESLLTADRPALLAEWHVVYEDGSREVFHTDEDTEVTADGPYQYADFYDGEIYDAGFEEEKRCWKKADVVTPKIHPVIEARYGEPVTGHEIFLPVSCEEVVREESGETELIYDFSQNIAGVVEFELEGKKEQKVLIRHAETMENGHLYRTNLRSAKQEICYYCKDGKQTYAPRFTYMGFRYISVSGITKEKIKVQARAIYSDLTITGEFSCSDEGLNQLQRNLVWSGKDNFVDIPTDCPQRDERQGWTGDIALFADTACFNFKMDRFLGKWLRDMKAEQGKQGSIPFVVPVRKGVTPSMTTSCWGDSCILVPYAVYKSTGNKEILGEMYPVMEKYLTDVARWALAGFVKYHSKYIFALPFQFGDWCAPYGNVKDWLGRGPWTGTAYYSYACQVMSKIAEALGRENDSAMYGKRAKKIADAYVKNFTDGNGTLKEEFQTGYVLPLYFKLAGEQQRKTMAENLWKLIQKNGGHLNTGFTATPYLLFALADNGHLEEAYQLLLEETSPSWLYQVKKGATTMWEQWDVIQEDGSIKEASMNHYAYGAVGDFFYRRICGLEPIEAGYRKFLVKPVPGGGLTYAQCSHTCMYGTIRVAWELEENRMKLAVDVPVGTTCMVELPHGKREELQSGTYELQENL